MYCLNSKHRFSVEYSVYILKISAYEISSKNLQTFLSFDHMNAAPVQVFGDKMFFLPSLKVFAPEVGLLIASNTMRLSITATFPGVQALF